MHGSRSFALPIARHFIICAITLATATAANLGAEDNNKTFRHLSDTEFKPLTEETNLGLDSVKGEVDKFLRRVLDAPKPEKREYVQKINDLADC